MLLCFSYDHKKKRNKIRKRDFIRHLRTMFFRRIVQSRCFLFLCSDFNREFESLKKKSQDNNCAGKHNAQRPNVVYVLKTIWLCCFSINSLLYVLYILFFFTFFWKHRNKSFLLHTHTVIMIDDVILLRRKDTYHTDQVIYSYVFWNSSTKFMNTNLYEQNVINAICAFYL